MKKRIIASLLSATVVAALLVGCSTVSGSSDLEPINLTNKAEISTLCGDDAQSVSTIIASAMDAKPVSGKRNALKAWGVKDPKDDKALATIKTAVDAQVSVACKDGDEPTAQLADFVDTESEDAAKEDLTVNPEDVLPKTAKCTKDEFLANSLPGAKLKWSDSVSTAFDSSKSSSMLTELLVENCQNPTVLAQVIDGFSETPVAVGSKTTIGDINPWAAAFLKKVRSGMGDGKSSIGFLTKKADTGDALYVTEDFQKYAALANTVLLRFHNAGVQKVNSTENWHVPAREGLVVGKLPVPVKSDKQEKGRETLVLQYTQKVDCASITIGFNVGDKRFEIIKTPKCETTPPTTTKPDCEKNCNPTTVKKCPPSKPYGTYPNCKDGPGSAPGSGNDNNANTGGGKNSNSGAGDKTNTNGNKPDGTTRTNPPKPPTDTSGNDDDSPAPETETGGGTSTNPSTGCVPRRGQTTC